MLVAPWMKRVVPFDFPLTLESMLFATRWPTADATTTERDPDVCFRGLDETLRATDRWLARAAHVSADRIGKLTEQQEIRQVPFAAEPDQDSRGKHWRPAS